MRSRKRGNSAFTVALDAASALIRKMQPLPWFEGLNLTQDKAGGYVIVVSVNEKWDTSELQSAYPCEGVTVKYQRKAR